MKTIARLRAVLVLAALAPAGCRAAGAAAPAQNASPQPSSVARRDPWLVTIVVDQLAAWIAAEHWPALPASGGFARLRREGLYVRQLRFAHAVTDTAQGHSALYTGATPRESGIVGNEVLGPDGKPVSLLADPATRAVDADGVAPRAGSSLAALEVETLADALVAARPDARVFSFSIKERSALFGGGRRPTLVLWLDPALEAFASSTAFTTRLPDWVLRLAGAAAVREGRARPWQLLDPAFTAAHAETKDDQPGEGDYDGLGVTFPHRVPAVRPERATPAGDDLLLALARAAAANAATGGGPVLLALSFSSHDYIAHVFGPNSWEAWDELLRLDATLAALLAALDGLVGPEHYAVMLAGDHGSNPLPELARTPGAPWCRSGRPDPWQRPCGAGRRLESAELTAALERAAAEVLGPAHWIAGVVEPLVYLTPEGRALPDAPRARLLKSAASMLRQRFDVADLVDLRALPARCPDLADESLPALVCRSLRPQGPGDFYVVPRPGTFFDVGYAPGHGTSHGSPYLYDRAVPLLVRAPGRVPAGTTREGPVGPAAFTRTAAVLLGVPAPAAARAGADLTQAR